MSKVRLCAGTALLVLCGCDSLSGPPDITSISISPSPISVVMGMSQQISVTAKYSDGSTRDVTTESGFTATGGSITVAGLFTAGTTAGTSFQITAAFENKSAQAGVTITEPAATALSVTPSPVSMQGAAARQFTATATYNNNTTRDVSAQAGWTATGGTITQTGLYTAPAAAGNFQVQAVFAGFTATASVTITIALQSIIMAPPSAIMLAGMSQQFVVQGSFSDGSMQNVTGAASITATGGGLGTGTFAGLFTAGPDPGEFTVRATYGGLAATAGVTIRPPLSVAITPPEQRIAGRFVNGVYRCDYSITASAIGGLPGQFATWGQGQLQWTLNSSGQVEVDVLTEPEMVAWFGSNRLNSGSSVASSRFAYWSGPFSVRFTFTYLLPGGEIRAATSVLRCD